MISVACQSPPNIDTGSYSEQTNGTVSTLAYSCPQGYSMSGAQMLKCGEDGSWDATAPSCGMTSLRKLAHAINRDFLSFRN